MDILGLSGIHAALVITALGIAATNIVGWLKSEEGFNPRHVAASAVIGLTVGLFTVATELGAIKTGLGELEQLVIFIGLVGQIAGFDYFAKKGVNAIKKCE